MKRALKWVAIIGGSLLIVIFLAFLIIPKLVNVQKYKPQIEKQVAEATGRTFSVGDDLRLSLFPWAGLSFSDLSLGSLPGFEQDKFVTVQSCKVQVKLVPLLFKDVQVKRFLLKGARIVLEKSKDGRVNWTFAKKVADKPKPEITPQEKESPAGKPDQAFPIKSLVVGDFAITQGSVIWIDHTKGQRKEISNVNLKLRNVSLERPFQLAFSAQLDGKPLELQGNVGPLGKDLGKGDVAVDLTFKALEQLAGGLKGRVINPAGVPRFDLNIKVSPFSPRKLMAVLKQPFPVKTADPQALSSISFEGKIAGDNQRVSVSNSVANIDGSKLKISLNAKEFFKPDVTFKADLDKIDLDRYLPPPENKNSSGPDAKGTASGRAVKSGAPGHSAGSRAAGRETKGKTAASGQKPIDYTPLRQLVLDGRATIGKLKVKNARVENVQLKIIGKNGIFKLDPLSMKLYQGGVAGKVFLSVQKDSPRTILNLKAEGIQAGPLLRDVLKKDILEGTLKAQVNTDMSGDNAPRIKESINGQGDLLFIDGAVKGIDLAGMVRNVKAAFGLAEKSTEKPKTDFAELHVPFTINRGLVNTPGATLASPLVRVLAAGKTDLVKESLDFRVEPKFVVTLKGQGDTKERSGIMVPVLVGGTFAEPKFEPDLEALVKDKLEKKLEDLQKKLLGKDKQNGKSAPVEELIKGFFKGLPFGK